MTITKNRYISKKSDWYKKTNNPLKPALLHLGKMDGSKAKGSKK